MVQVFIPKERRRGERRVAATPETVRRMVASGLSVAVEAGAGEEAYVSNDAFREVGAEIRADLRAAWAAADVVLKVAPLCAHAELGGTNEAQAIREGAVLVGFCKPHRYLDEVRMLRDRNVTSLAMELVPRITRAQPMDALSSQASIAGYKAAVLAAARVSRYFPLLMTAAGTIRPCRVVIMGAGVAGLQAVATCKRLGAVVEVSDIRPAVREEVESLGGRFIEIPMEETGEGEGGYAKEMKEDFLERQRRILTERVSVADAVITTALIPGRPAPLLVTREMVEAMRPGSVLIDLAGEEGGNCELSQPDQEVVHNGVKILAPTNLPSTMSMDATALYARNVYSLLNTLLHEGEVAIDEEDDVVAGALLTHGGEIKHGPTAARLDPRPDDPAPPADPSAPPADTSPSGAGESEATS